MTWVTTAFGTRAKVYVHRYALELYLGKLLPPELKACHRCDNPPCCNPLHLFAGTSSENNQDMSDKGRNAAQRPGVHAGEKNNHARLTWAIVRQMREEWDRRAWPSKAVGAARYGIHASTFGDIVERRTWWPEPERTES